MGEARGLLGEVVAGVEADHHIVMTDALSFKYIIWFEN